MPATRRTFKCGHFGKGKFCHRCAQVAQLLKPLGGPPVLDPKVQIAIDRLRAKRIGLEQKLAAIKPPRLEDDVEAIFVYDGRRQDVRGEITTCDAAIAEAEARLYGPHTSQVREAMRLEART